jgi:hypothetical protein
MEPGGTKSAWKSRHVTAVRHDRAEVEKHPGTDERHSRQAEVGGSADQK